jgi:hypothetical protein
VRTLWSWSEAVRSVVLGGQTIVELAGGVRHEHRRTATGWSVDLVDRSRRESIDLLLSSRASGARVGIYSPSEVSQPESREPYLLPSGASVDFDLGEKHYRRSEQSWHDAGEPTAHVTLTRRERTLELDITVAKREPLTFVAANAENPFDNEHPDVNGDGIQLYVSDGDRISAWMLVPETDSALLSGADARTVAGTVRVRRITGSAENLEVTARWERTQHGYRVRATVDVASLVGSRPVSLDVLVNEKPPGRERRRGQLVLRGAAGQFVYLRGDRHEREQMLLVRFPL